MNPKIYTLLGHELFKINISFTGTGDGFEFDCPKSHLRITHNGEKFLLDYTNKAGEHLETVAVTHISTVLRMVQMEKKGLFQ